MSYHEDAPAPSGRPLTGFDSPSASSPDTLDSGHYDKIHPPGVDMGERPPPSVDPRTAPSEAGRLEADSPVLDLELRSLPGLSTRLVHCLVCNQLPTLRHALALSEDELMALRGFGKGQLDELRSLNLDAIAVAILAVPPAGPAAGGAPPLSAATAVESLPLPKNLLRALSCLGAVTVTDITAFSTDELEHLHGLGRPGRLLLEQVLVSSRVPWDGASLRVKPAMNPRAAATVSLLEAGLTEAARIELAARRHSTLRHVSTWDASTLASVISAETFAEAEAALTWYGLSFIDTARVATFVQGVRQMRDHYEEHGFVPGARAIYNGFRLGQWVMMTRQAFNKGELDPSRIHVLEQLPYWTWSGDNGGGLRGKRLANILESARTFAAAHGHLHVPTTGEHAFLHRGLRSVREAHEFLPAAAISDFEALPDWTWDQAQADARYGSSATNLKAERPPSPQWLSNLEALRVQALAAGGLDKVSLYGAPDTKRIAHWATSQRARRKLLSSAQRSLLEAIPGWTWDGMAARDARHWSECLARLEAYVSAGNTPDVPAVFRYDGFGLGDWVRKQHRIRDTLTPQQVAQLEAIPGWSWRRSDPRRPRDTRVTRATMIRREVKWEATRRLAVAFFEEHHVWPPAGTVTNFGLDLGAWVINQRAARTRLAPHRRAALDATPGWRWNGQAQRGGRYGPNLRYVCTNLGIEPGAILLARGAKYEAEALLDDEYRVEVVSTPGEGAYETPTRAWYRATAGESNQNGWDAWNIEFDGEMTPLRRLRDRVAQMDLHADGAHMEGPDVADGFTEESRSAAGS